MKPHGKDRIPLSRMTKQPLCGILDRMNAWSLFCYSGPGAGRVIQLDKPLTIVGRGHEADLRTLDNQASRRHCVLAPKGDMVIVKDLNSANGTFSKGRRLKQCALRLGDSFTIGQSEFFLIHSDEFLKAGDTVGLWQIKKLTALTPAGWHFVARQNILERDVALEVLRGPMIQDDALLALYRGILRRVAAQNDPSIAAILDHCEDQGKVLVARSLTSLTKVDWPSLNLFERADILGEFLDILSRWTEKGMTVPLGLDRFSLNPDGHLIFQLPSARDLYIVRKRQHILLPEYLAFAAPEELMGSPTSPKAEMYRVGVLLFQGLTGLLPRAGGSRKEIEQSFRKPPLKARQVVPFISPQADMLLDRLLLKQPDARPSLNEVCDTWHRLKFLRRKVPVQARPASPMPTPAPAQPKPEAPAPRHAPPKKAPLPKQTSGVTEPVPPRPKPVRAPFRKQSKAMAMTKELFFVAIQTGVFFLAYNIVYWLLKQRS